MYDVVSLHFTNDCNLKCPFCYRGKGKETMDEDLFFGLPRYLKDITDQVALGGGEPTLYPEMVQRFAKECKDYDLICNVTTNGLAFKEWDEYKTGEFCENLTMVSVSMDQSKFWKWKNTEEFISACNDMQEYTLVGCNLLLDQDLMSDLNLIKATNMLFEDAHLDRLFTLYPKNFPGPDILDKRHHFIFLSTLFDNFYIDDLTNKILDEERYSNWTKPCHYGRDIISIDEIGQVTGCSFSKNHKLKLREAKDVLKVNDLNFEERFSCPYLRR